MAMRKLIAATALLSLGALLPIVAHAAAQLAAGAATSAAPTAPKGSSLRQLQIQFDPGSTTGGSVDLTKSVFEFQLTVGWDPSQVTLAPAVDATGRPLFDSNGLPTADYSNTHFVPRGGATASLIGPFTQSASQPQLAGLPQGFNTFTQFATIKGIATAVEPGDVNIFSLPWTLLDNTTDSTLVKFAIFSSDHTADSTRLGADFISSKDISTGQLFTNSTTQIETTAIQASRSGQFVMVAGNSALPEPSSLSLLGLAGLGLWGRSRARGNGRAIASNSAETRNNSM